MVGCVATVIFSEYVKSLFGGCIFFIAFSFFVNLLLIVFSHLKSEIPKEKDMVEVIALCDIPQNEYGNVYYLGKSYRMKNNSTKTIKKGEVPETERRELF